MAEKNPSVFTPWFDTLKGISKSGSPSNIEGAPPRHSYSSKVSPLDMTAMRTTSDSEPYSVDYSSFSFSRSVIFEPVPQSAARKSFGTIPGSSSRESLGAVSGSPGRKGLGTVPESPAPQGFGPVPGYPVPKSTLDKGPAVVDVQPKKEELQSLPPAQIPSAPPAILLSPPPMTAKAKAGDVPTGFSSPSPAFTKPLQHQVGQDFIYHPKSDDRFYPSVKYDLGPPEKKPRRVWRCCCWTLCIVLLVVTGLAIAMGVLMVELKPKTPSLSIGNISVPSLDFNQSSSEVAFGVDFPFNLTNPNKHAEVLYDEISVSVYFEDLFLGSTNAIAAFEQGTRSTNAFTTDLPRNVTIVPSVDETDLQGQVQGGDVQIDLRGSVEGRYKILGHEVKEFSIPIVCHLTLKPNAAGEPATVVGNSCYQT